MRRISESREPRKRDTEDRVSDTTTSHYRGRNSEGRAASTSRADPQGSETPGSKVSETTERRSTAIATAPGIQVSNKRGGFPQQ
jgi:hypothetical protein